MAEAAGLYYELHGPDDAPPLILSSGLGGSATYWAPNLPALAGHFRVLVYDHRGTGRSDRAPLARLTVEDMADDMVALLDHAGIARAHVAGHALGGLAGMALAHRTPKRIGRLVVVNGWLSIEPHTIRCFDTRLALLRHAGVDAFLHAQPIFLYPANWLAAEADRIAAEEAAHRRHFPGADTMEQRIAAARAFDAREWIGTIDAPLLAVSTEDDVLVPSIASSRIVDRLAAGKGGTHAALRWGGHACNVTDSDTFDRLVLDFLRS